MPSHRSLFRPSCTFRAAAVGAVTLASLSLSLGTAPARAADPAGSPQAAGTGLRAGTAAWPRWQGRVSLTSMSGDLISGGRHESGFGGRTRQSLSLLGDYYFIQQGLAPSSAYSGGFRASGGMILGTRAAPGSLLPSSTAGLGSGFSAERRSFSLLAPPSALDGADTGTQSVPYVGIGYTGLQSIRGTGGGWGFSADLGVMALQPRSAVRLGQQSLGNVVRDLDISPLLQLGVSYSF